MLNIVSGIESINKQLEKFKLSYETCNDCVEGQEAVKKSKNIETYLPKLSGQLLDSTYGQKLYDSYKNYAYFFPSVGRTVDGYTGVAFRKAPAIELKNDNLLKDITLDGKTLVDFSKSVFEEVVINYRPCILVDYSKDANRAYMRMYKTLDILDWRAGYINGVNQVNFVKLKEIRTVTDPENEFNNIDLDQIRILDIYDDIYRQRTYIKSSSSISIENSFKESIVIKDNEYTLFETINPVMNNNYFKYIPCFPISTKGLDWDLDYSPINDLADVSINFFRVSASHKNAQLLTGNPTPCLIGLQDDDDDEGVSLGSSRVLTFNEGGSSWFLTLGSEGLLALENDLATLKNDMAVVGARILSSDPNGVESAETAQIHRAGEQSVLMALSNSVSNVIEKALKLAVEWSGDSSDKVTFSLVVDFDTTGISQPILNQLWLMYNAGNISFATLFAAMKKGEIYPNGWTEKDELKAIAKDNEEKEVEVVTEPLSTNDIDIEEDEKDVIVDETIEKE